MKSKNNLLDIKERYPSAFFIIDAIHPQGDEGPFTDPIPQDIRADLVRSECNPYAKVLDDIYRYSPYANSENYYNVELVGYSQYSAEQILSKNMQYQVQCLYAKLIRLVSEEIKSFDTGIDIIEIIKSTPYWLEEYYNSGYYREVMSIVTMANSISTPTQDNESLALYIETIDNLFIRIVDRLNRLLCNIIPLYSDVNPDVYIRSLDAIYSSFGEELLRLFFRLLGALTLPMSSDDICIEEKKEDKENEN